MTREELRGKVIELLGRYFERKCDCGDPDCCAMEEDPEARAEAILDLVASDLFADAATICRQIADGCEDRAHGDSARLCAVSLGTLAMAIRVGT